jgi:hypothetical protein
MDVTVSGEILGFSQCKNGTMNRDVCSADIRSVEAKKITASQAINGSQYLRKDFIESSDSFALRAPQFTID